MARGWLSSPVFAASVAAFLAALPACSSEDACEPGTQRCQSGVPQSCTAHRGTCGAGDASCSDTRGTWTNGTVCAGGTSCVVAQGAAVCSLTPRPVAECASPSTLCVGNEMAVCGAGYPLLAVSCTGMGKTCKEEPLGVGVDGGPLSTTCAYCSDGTETPDRNCTAGALNTCVSGALYECACGDRTARHQDCSGAGDHCQTAQQPGGLPWQFDSFCTLSNEPDPRCAGPIDAMYCGSNGLEVTCHYGYDIAAPAPPCD